jgi:acyl-CoA reductase-like NAD-dependent aldehyde dehydrogenase
LSRTTILKSRRLDAGRQQVLAETITLEMGETDRAGGVGEVKLAPRFTDYYAGKTTPVSGPRTTDTPGRATVEAADWRDSASLEPSELPYYQIALAALTSWLAAS